jgi:hypothetical protein
MVASLFIVAWVSCNSDPSLGERPYAAAITMQPLQTPSSQTIEHETASRQPEVTNMVRPEDVIGVGISLKIDENISLFALVSADGSINRMGTGTVNNTEKEMFIGVTDPNLFENLRPHLNMDLFKWIGSRADQNAKGKTCELNIHLLLPNKEERAISFKYGSESMGPPPEIRRLVIKAVEITDPWYEQFKAGVAKQKK